MDEQEGTPGREPALPGPNGKGTFKPLPVGLGPEARAFAEALREQFSTCGLSLREFKARYYYDFTAVSQYLNADRIPNRRFVEDVLAAADAQLGAPVTVEVQQRLFALHLEALKATNTILYENQILSERLMSEISQAEAARRQEQALVEELAATKARDHQLRMRVRELEAARDEDQVRVGAELDRYQAENHKLHEELRTLRTRIAALEQLLDQASTRRLEAEVRCEQLERALATTEEDVERERREDLLQAQKREQARQAEEAALRASLADLQNKAEERVAMLAEEHRRAVREVEERRQMEEQRLRELVTEREREAEERVATLTEAHRRAVFDVEERRWAEEQRLRELVAERERELEQLRAQVSTAPPRAQTSTPRPANPPTTDQTSQANSDAQPGPAGPTSLAPVIMVSFDPLDRPWARWLSTQLIEYGYRVVTRPWPSQPPLAPGAEPSLWVTRVWPSLSKSQPQLASHLNNAQCALFLVSHAYARARDSGHWLPQMLTEVLTGGSSLRANILPILIEKCDIDLRMSAKIAVDLTDMDKDTGMQAVATLLGNRGFPPPHRPSRPAAPTPRVQTDTTVTDWL